MPDLATIAIDRIEIGQRLRDISEAQVEALAKSIGDVGILNPVTVYERKVGDGPVLVDGYGLVAGAHRVEACKRIGLTEVPAQIVGLSDLERQIAECDENLYATTLTKSERAMFTRRRKDAYEALHPETRHGGDRASRKVDDLKEAERFTVDTAKKTGRSESSVQKDAQRGMKISDRALAAVKGTKLDSGAYLDKLKDVPQAEQVERVKADLTPRKPVEPPTKPHDPQEAYNKWATDMNKVWSRAPQEWRERWLKSVQ